MHRACAPLLLAWTFTPPAIASDCESTGRDDLGQITLKVDPRPSAISAATGSLLASMRGSTILEGQITLDAALAGDTSTDWVIESPTPSGGAAFRIDMHVEAPEPKTVDGYTYVPTTLYASDVRLLLPSAVHIYDKHTGEGYAFQVSSTGCVGPAEPLGAEYKWGRLNE